MLTCRRENFVTDGECVFLESGECLLPGFSRVDVGAVAEMFEHVIGLRPSLVNSHWSMGWDDEAVGGLKVTWLLDSVFRGCSRG